ncbi:MAG: T9SS type A sorting domain-containing protein, partial [Calditrichaeota bacterium]|nr:T9SS type A sorting domain-containing protein [Calditrichota bacterium]
EMTQEIRDRYADDWKNWPADLGAPFVDVDLNGIYNPVLDADGYPDMSKGDYPGIKNATQVIWYTMTDGDEGRVIALSGSKPINFELQVTVWGYNSEPYQNVIFKKFRLKYKGDVQATEVRVGYFMDPDIGDYSDDLAGCDSDLNLGFAYNGNSTDSEFGEFNIVPPAVGVMLVPWLTDDPNLQQLHSFGYFSAGGDWSDPVMGVYEGTLQWFNLLRGYLPTNDIDNPTPFTHKAGSNKGFSTFFPLDGDPETGGSGGDVDGIENNQKPGDRRIVITLPEFSMNPGEEKSFTFAILGRIGKNNLNSVTGLKELAQNLKENALVTVSTRVIKREVSFTESSSLANVNFQFKIKSEGDSVSSAKLILHSTVGDDSPLTLYLVDNGLDGDEVANDGIWTFKGNIQQQKYPVYGDLEINFVSGKTASVSKIIEYASIRKPPAISDYRVIWENGKQDKKLNHGETAQIGLTVLNRDNLHEINQLAVSIGEFSQTFDVDIPANGKDANSVYFQITAPDTGNFCKGKFLLMFDGNRQKYSFEIPLEKWSPSPHWGDTLSVKRLSGIGTTMFPVIADVSLLNGHQYKVTFRYENESAKTNLLWSLEDLTSGEFKLKDQPVPEDAQASNPVIDGIQWIVYSPLPGLRAVVQVADADGSLTPDEYDASGAPFGGNNVWHSFSSPNDANRFYVSAGGGSGTMDRILRSIANANGHDFELRFTEEGGIYTWWYNSDTYASVPFEAWDVGVSTFSDSSDDIRCLTGGYSGGATADSFDFAYSDPYLGFPATDWIYIRKPLNDAGSYEVYAEDVTSGKFSFSWWLNSEEVLSRIIICDVGGAGTLPETGTVIRFITSKNLSPSDTFLVTATPTGINEQEQYPLSYQLKQNYPNPFNPQTTIEFVLAQKDEVRLEIFNLLGQKVRTLAKGNFGAGSHRFVWDGCNDGGTILPSGIYIYRLKTKNYTSARRMLLIR